MTPNNIIHNKNQLIFTKIINTILNLKKIPNLIPTTNTSYKFNPITHQQKNLTKIILSHTSPLINTTIQKTKFKQLYDTTIVTIHHNNIQITNKINNIILKPNNTLLLQTHTNFITQHQNNQNFYLINNIKKNKPQHHNQTLLTKLLTLLLIT